MSSLVRPAEATPGSRALSVGDAIALTGVGLLALGLRFSALFGLGSVLLLFVVGRLPSGLGGRGLVEPRGRPG